MSLSNHTPRAWLASPTRSGHAPSGNFKGGEKSRGERNGAVVKRSRIAERNAGRAE